MIFIMTDNNEKSFHYRFTEEELTMYNSIIVASVIRTIMSRAIDQGYDLEELKQKVLPPEFIQGEFSDKMKSQIQSISKGKFDMNLFIYEDD